MLKYTILAIVVFLFVWNESSGSERDTFDIIQINPCERIQFNSLHEMMELKEFSECISRIDTTQGLILGNYIGVKQDTAWMIWMQPNFAYDTKCGINVLSTELRDVFGSDKKELILTFGLIENDMQGRWKFEFLQIWDLDRPALLFETMTREHFEKFTDADGMGACIQEVIIKKNKIVLLSAVCHGKTDDFELLESLSGSEVILFEE